VLNVTVAIATRLRLRFRPYRFVNYDYFSYPRRNYPHFSLRFSLFPYFYLYLYLYLYLIRIFNSSFGAREYSFIHLVITLYVLIPRRLKRRRKDQWHCSSLVLVRLCVLKDSCIRRRIVLI
jgi:hypothetical protein